MADPGIQNWKEKYLLALEEFEASHKKDLQRLDILRRGLVRVSLAADGLDTSLDEQLAELRGNLRSNRDIVTLEPLVAQLERTVVALDDRRKQEHDQLLTLLEDHLDRYAEMDLPRQEKSALKQLRKDLPRLIASNGTKLEMWQGVQQVQEQIRQTLLAKIEELSQQRGGFFSRLFGGAKPAADMSAATAAPSIAPTRVHAESDAMLANLDQVNGQDVPLPGSDESTSQDNSALTQRLRNTLCSLLDHLEVPVEFTSRKEKLVDRVKSEFALDLLPDMLDEAAQLVASTRMMAQKEFEGFLVALHQRLQDIQQFLDTARAGEEQSLRNQKKLDADVRKELKEIRSSVDGGEDIHRLRDEIDGMVNRIVAAVDSFHSEEKKRRDDVFGRIEQLAQRMESMEAEATELKSSLEAQRIEALRDALTEMPNRAAYDEQIEREFSRWRRHGRPLSICVVDIDHFKHINDTLGHLRGDKVLKLVAREISRKVRNEDFVARYGGEEFVIIMPETDQQSALAAAEKVRLAVAECPFNFNNERLPVTASFGVASFSEGDEIETCFERADKALYRAKSLGRNRVERG
jgi:diguanylate cyclase